MADYDYTDVNTGEDFTDDEMEDRYEELLNEIYEGFTVGALTYSAGRVLRDIDYTAFREGFNDWIDSEISDGNFREYSGDDDDDDEEICDICGLPFEDCNLE